MTSQVIYWILLCNQVVCTLCILNFNEHYFILPLLLAYTRDFCDLVLLQCVPQVHGNSVFTSSPKIICILLWQDLWFSSFYVNFSQNNHILMLKRNLVKHINHTDLIAGIQKIYEDIKYRSGSVIGYVRLVAQLMFSIFSEYHSLYYTHCNLLMWTLET